MYIWRKPYGQKKILLRNEHESGRGAVLSNAPFLGSLPPEDS